MADQLINIEINDCLCKVQQFVQLSNEAGFFDINKICENFYCRLLNMIYGCEFVNTNLEHKNSTAIDLGDKNKKLCIQVTSENTPAKIRSTIEKFLKKKMYKDYNRLIFVMITGGNKTTVKFDTKKKFVFKNTRDIKTIADLYSDLSNLEIEKKKKILDFLKLSLNENPILFNFDEVVKLNYKLDDDYVERKVCSSSGYNSEVYILENDKENLNDVLKNKSRVVLLSDAGYGKSELCKNLANHFNEVEDKFRAFYYRLIDYTNQKIDDLIPNEYLKVPRCSLVFVLDGFDEIEESSKNTFIKNLQFFLNKNPDSKILLSSRTNFYKPETSNYEGLISGFNTYYLLPFSTENIKELLVKHNINYEQFSEETLKKGLRNLVYNPFYLIKMIKKYEEDNYLPAKSKFIKEIIYDTFDFDEKKFKTTKDIDKHKTKLYRLLSALGLSMRFLERNYLTIEEFENLINNDSGRQLLQYSGIWKNYDGKFLFTHNNFGEYLSADLLKDCSFEEIKSIVTYDNNPDRIKDSWLNTISFLVDDYNDIELKKWLVEKMPECLYFFEKDDIDFKNRILLFEEMFKIFEDKKIWIPFHLYSNSRFIDFISSSEVIEYLLKKIAENRHYTIVTNALSILGGFNNLYGKEAEVKKIITDICMSNDYNSTEKRYALTILTNNGIMNNDLLKEIIEFNKENEDAYMRTAYFYVLNKSGVNSDNIEIALNRILDVKRGSYCVSYSDDDEDDDKNICLADEHMEYEKIYSKIVDKETFEKVISFLADLSRKNIHDILDHNTLENICESFSNIYPIDNTVYDSMFSLYQVCDKNIEEDGLKSIPLVLDKFDLRLKLFADYLNLKKDKRYYSNYYLIDDKCLNFFIEEYKKDVYTNEKAREILSFTNHKTNGYYELGELYFNKTGEEFVGERLKYSEKNIEQGNTKQDFFNCLFDRTSFVKCLEEFFQVLDKQEMTVDEIDDIDYYTFYNNEKLECMKHFLSRCGRKKDVISKKIFKKSDWETFIFVNVYNSLIQDDGLIIDERQKKTIYEICLKKLKTISFKNAIEYKDNGKSFTSKWYNIYLWYFMHKFNFEYPEEVLLDMLEFNWTVDNEEPNIDFIEKRVSKGMISQRIEENLKTKEIYNKVLTNHVEYCKKHMIKGLTPYLEKYLMNNDLFIGEKHEIIDYMIFDVGCKYMVDNYMNKVNLETHIALLDKIFDFDKNTILDYLKENLKNTTDYDRKVLYSKYLMKANQIEGIETYFDLLKTNMKNIGTIHRDGINEALSSITSKDLLDIVLKIYLLTYDKDFKDRRFESLNNCCKNAIINIGLSDVKKGTFELVVEKLNNLIKENKDIPNIGFTNYIIEELNQKYYQIVQDIPDIDKVADKVNEILNKSKQEKKGIEI